MSNWAELQKHMRQNYRPHDDEGDMMSMIWSYESGRQQKILIRRFVAAGQEMVEFKSPFARQGAVDPEDMLRENTRLPFGSIALSNDIYIVIENTMLLPLGLGDFEFLIGRIAAVADHLESIHGDADAF